MHDRGFSTTQFIPVVVWALIGENANTALLLNLILLNKTIRKNVIEHKSLWEKRCAAHFPDFCSKEKRVFLSHDKKEIEIFLEEKKIDGYTQFKILAKSHYNGMSKRHVHLFWMIKEGNLEDIQQAQIELNELFLKDQYSYIGHLYYSDLNLTVMKRISLIEWANKKKHQPLLDYFYSLAMTEVTLYKKDSRNYSIINYQVVCNQLSLLADSLNQYSHLINRDELLHQSVDCFNTEAATLLIKFNPSMPISNTSEKILLIRAISRQDSAMVSLLIAHGANASFEFTYRLGASLGKEFSLPTSVTCLSRAIETDNLFMVKLLLEKGATFQDSFLTFQDINACIKRASPNMVDFLILYAQLNNIKINSSTDQNENHVKIDAMPSKRSPHISLNMLSPPRSSPIHNTVQNDRSCCKRDFCRIL